MTIISIKAQITSELERLRVWRDVTREDEYGHGTEKAHKRIDALLDALDAETARKVLAAVTDVEAQLL